MEGKVYHGSYNGDIKELKKNISTHKKECVYATDNEVIALLFASRGNGDLDTVKGYDNGKVILVERRKGILEHLYNKVGYLYELDGKNFEHYDYLWKPEVISFHDEKIIGCKKIDSILDKLKEYEKQDKIKIYTYPDRPSDIPLDNSDLIEIYKRFESNGIKGSINQLLEFYPGFKDKL